MLDQDTHVQGAQGKTGRRKQPFGTVDTAVMRDESLPWQVKALYTCLVTYCGEKREAFPSLNRIARESGMSRSSVLAAIRCAEECKLIEVRAEFARDGERSDDPDKGEQTSNRYLLRDFEGGYKTGHGPGRRLPYPSDRGVAVTPHPVEPLDPASAAAIPEQDHRSWTTPKSTHTSPDEDAASGRRETRRKIKLFRPKRWTELDTEQAAQDTCAYVARAFKAIGLRPTDEAMHALGRSIQKWDEDGVDRVRMWANVRREVDKFGIKEPYLDWLVPLPPHLSVVR